LEKKFGTKVVVIQEDNFNLNPKRVREFCEEKIKTALKYWGLTEVFSYSMVSKDLLAKTQFASEDYLKIANPLSDEWEYLRQNIIPSHLNILSQNTSLAESLSIFEIANIYLELNCRKKKDYER